MMKMVDKCNTETVELVLSCTQDTAQDSAKHAMTDLPLAFKFSRAETCRNTDVSSFLGIALPSEPCGRPLYYTRDKAAFRGADYLAVTFSLFFADNPGYRVCGCVTAGRHSGDVERVVVLFDEADSEPCWVYYGAHGAGQGVWRQWADCEKTAAGHLVVHVAPQSHGMYPEKGRYLRVFGFANDVCDDDGEAWIPDEACRCDARRQTWSTSHYKVCRGVDSPAYVRMPTDRSIEPWERFFIALPCVQRRVRAGAALLGSS